MKIIPTDTLPTLRDLAAPTGPGFGGFLTDANGDLVETDELTTAETEDDDEVRNRAAWDAALSDDLRPLGDALWGAAQAGDKGAMDAALRKISESLPDYLAAPGLEAALEQTLAAALAGTDSE